MDQDLYRRALALFDYDRKTGMLYRRGSKRQMIHFRGNDPGVVALDGRQWMAGRIVWLMHEGAFPPGRLRYMNGNFRDTRIENLGCHVIGGGLERLGNAWVAYGATRRKPIGSFRTFKAALKAREAWERGEYADDLV